MISPRGSIWRKWDLHIHISTFRDPGPAKSPAVYPENDSDVIGIEPEQLEEDLEGDEEEYDDPEDDPDDDSPVHEDDDDSESDERSASDQTACAGSPAQAVPKLPSDSSHRGRTVTATACAATNSNAPSRRDETAATAPQSNPSSRSDSTACAGPPAQAFSLTEYDPDDDDPEENDGEEEYDEEDSELDNPEDDDPEGAREDDGELEEVEDHVLEEHATACAASPAQAVPAVELNSHSRGRSLTATTCAAPSAQDSANAGALDDSDEPDNDPGTELEELEDEVPEEHATAYAASLAQAVEKLTGGSNHRGRTATATACAALPRTSRGSSAQAGAKQYSNPASRCDSTACAASPAQDSAHNAAPESAPAPQSGAMQHSNPASRSDNTACAAPPAQAFPVSLRHPGPYGISAPSAIGSNPAPQPGFSRIDLIYRPAIRNDGKP